MTKTRVVHCKIEPYDFYIGRPSKYGNPFSHKPVSRSEIKVATRIEAVEKFREWFLNQPELIEAAKKELKGKVLGCWCGPNDLCHGSVIAEIIDTDEEKEEK